MSEKQTDECRFLAQQFAPFNNEAFMVTLANKGLYKRALKDIESATVNIGVTDGFLQVDLGEAVVILNPNVAQSKCSCPSKTTCKHLLMAIMAVSELSSQPVTEVSEIAAATEATSETQETEKSATEVSQEEPWEAIKKADVALLRKQAGKKLFDDCLKMIQEGWTADFEEKEMLEATINTEQISVFFPKHDSLNRAVCKCGNQGLCKHKLIAILSYLSANGAINDETEQITLLSDHALELLPVAQQFVTQMFEKGIINGGENEVEAAIQFSIKMEACGLGNIARLFRSLSSDLENMHSKHIGFDQIVTSGTLSRLHNTMRMIVKHAGNAAFLKNLIEGSRSEYYTTPIGHFTALGSLPWQTRSGFFGITVYLYYHEKKCICTYTSSMADYYEKTQNLVSAENIRWQYRQNDHWENSMSLETISSSVFTLRNFKMNQQFRVSSSKQTLCDVTSDVTKDYIDGFEEIKHLFEIPEPIPYDYFGQRQQEQIVLIPFNKIGNVVFDRTEQDLQFTLEDGKSSHPAVLPYSTFSAYALSRIEMIGRMSDGNTRYMVCISKVQHLLPVCMIGKDEIDNIYYG